MNRLNIFKKWIYCCLLSACSSVSPSFHVPVLSNRASLMMSPSNLCLFFSARIKTSKDAKPNQLILLLLYDYRNFSVMIYLWIWMSLGISGLSDAHLKRKVIQYESYFFLDLWLVGDQNLGFRRFYHKAEQIRDL